MQADIICLRHGLRQIWKKSCLQQVLKSNGRLTMVHRPERFLDIIETMTAHNLAPKRIQFVYPKANRSQYASH